MSTTISPSSLDLVNFIMLVHLSGATSSPSSAHFVLRKCAEDKKEQFCCNTIEELLHWFYADHCLLSTKTEEEAVLLNYKLFSIFSKGGFVLTKWVSNSPAMMEVILQHQRANIDLDWAPLSVERVLGIRWSTQSDASKSKVVVQDGPLTRQDGPLTRQERESLCHHFSLGPPRNPQAHLPALESSCRRLAGSNSAGMTPNHHQLHRYG